MSAPGPRILTAADHVTPAVLTDAEHVLDGWYADADRIDWDDFIDRLAACGVQSADPYDFDVTDSPAIRKIQRHVRALRQAT